MSNSAPRKKESSIFLAGIVSLTLFALFCFGTYFSSPAAASQSSHLAALFTLSSEDILDEETELYIRGNVSSTGLDTLDAPVNDVWQSDLHYSYPASGGAGAVIYIVDTGIESLFAFGDRLMPGYSADGGSSDGRNDCEGHGTAVASVAASHVGVAPKATIVPVQVKKCDSESFDTNALAEGIRWVIANHNYSTTGIINISSALQIGDGFDGETTDASDAIVEALDAGFFVVQSAGNNSNPKGDEKSRFVNKSVGTTVVDACQVEQSNNEGLFTVGSYSFEGGQGSRAAFSNSGGCVDIWAPGSKVETLNLDGDIEFSSGTSFSAPMVAGVAALIVGEYPSISASEIKEKILATAGDGNLSSGMEPFEANTRYYNDGEEMIIVTISSRTTEQVLRIPAKY